MQVHHNIASLNTMDELCTLLGGLHLDGQVATISQRKRVHAVMELVNMPEDAHKAVVALTSFKRRQKQYVSTRILPGIKPTPYKHQTARIDSKQLQRRRDNVFLVRRLLFDDGPEKITTQLKKLCTVINMGSARELVCYLVAYRSVVHHLISKLEASHDALLRAAALRDHFLDHLEDHEGLKGRLLFHTLFLNDVILVPTNVESLSQPPRVRADMRPSSGVLLDLNAFENDLGRFHSRMVRTETRALTGSRRVLDLTGFTAVLEQSVLRHAGGSPWITYRPDRPLPVRLLIVRPLPARKLLVTLKTRFSPFRLLSWDLLVIVIGHMVDVVVDGASVDFSGGMATKVDLPVSTKRQCSATLNLQLVSEATRRETLLALYRGRRFLITSQKFAQTICLRLPIVDRYASRHQPMHMLHHLELSSGFLEVMLSNYARVVANEQAYYYPRGMCVQAAVRLYLFFFINLRTLVLHCNNDSGFWVDSPGLGRKILQSIFRPMRPVKRIRGGTIRLAVLQGHLGPQPPQTVLRQVEVRRTWTSLDRMTPARLKIVREGDDQLERTLMDGYSDMTCNHRLES